MVIVYAVLVKFFPFYVYGEIKMSDVSVYNLQF